jgi:glycine/D-amino acid oxidase-like deaminating enzyme
MVLATEAWARSAPELGSKLRPLYSYIVLTEPLSKEQWSELGWEGREAIADKRNYLSFCRPTADGRILFGGGDAVYYGDIDADHDSSPVTFATLERTLAATFPQLATPRITHRWGGPVAFTGSFLPLFGTLPGGRVHYGVGYGGHGVAASHLGGKILRDLVLGRESEYSTLFLVNGKEPVFPFEPLTRLGMSLSRWSLRRQDRQLERRESGGATDPLLLRLMRKLG